MSGICALTSQKETLTSEKLKHRIPLCVCGCGCVCGCVGVCVGVCVWVGGWVGGLAVLWEGSKILSYNDKQTANYL